MCFKSWIKCSILVLVLGILLLATGCVFIVVLPDIIHEKIKEEMPLTAGSEAYKAWINPPVPISFQIFVYHTLNPKEVVESGAKPMLVQKGPYTYREHKTKVNLTYTDDGCVSYREIVSYVFERDKSSGPEEEKITTLNIPMITVAAMIRYEYSFVQEFTQILLDLEFDSHLFIKLTVKELMWGYEDNLLKYVKKMMTKYDLGPFDDHFGFFYQRNNTDNGLFKIDTGKTNLDQLGIIRTWNNISNLHFWSSYWSNMINGTDGTIFHAFMQKTDKLYFYNKDMCRSIYLTYDGDSSVKGIDTYKFTIPREVFDDYIHNPDNTGFCTPAGNCLPSGLLNCTVCRNGAAAIVSQPHFYHANQSVVDSIYGMNPTDELQTTLHIEPMLGVVFSANVKLQINIFIEKVPHIRETQHIPNTVFPVFWFNELFLFNIFICNRRIVNALIINTAFMSTAIVDDSLAESFRTGVELPLLITQYAQYGLIVVGGLMILASLSFIAKKTILCKKTEEEELLINKSDKDGDKISSERKGDNGYNS